MANRTHFTEVGIIVISLQTSSRMSIPEDEERRDEGSNDQYWHTSSIQIDASNKRRDQFPTQPRSSCSPPSSGQTLVVEWITTRRGVKQSCEQGDEQRVNALHRCLHSNHRALILSRDVEFARGGGVRPHVEASRPANGGDEIRVSILSRDPQVRTNQSTRPAPNPRASSAGLLGNFAESGFDHKLRRRDL